jgi:hypothetical protein
LCTNFPSLQSQQLGWCITQVQTHPVEIAAKAMSGSACCLLKADWRLATPFQPVASFHNGVYALRFSAAAIRHRQICP